MRRFTAIVAAYNCMEWIPRCLVSLDAQELPLDVCVVDDASTDPDQAEFIEAFCKRKGWEYILNGTRRGPLFNQAAAINHMNMSDNDVIVFVDGDDRLAHPKVINVLDYYYARGNLMTYGSYEPIPASPTCSKAQPYPDKCLRNRDFRNGYKWGILFNHLRTIDYKLFKHLDTTDFTYPNGKWFTAGGDTAIMIPCLEMAGRRHAVIRDVLYYYNSENPISEWREIPREVDRVHDYIFKMPKKDEI